LDIGVLGYIGIVWPKEHSPEVWHIPPGTPCIYRRTSVPMESVNSFSTIQISKSYWTSGADFCPPVYSS